MPDQYRRCRTCRVDKPLDDYHRSKGRPLGRGYVCKVCVSAESKTPGERARRRAVNERRNERSREVMHAIKAKPCMDCGGVFPHFVMEFDHPDRSVKTGTISMMLGGGVTARVLAEIAKCDLVCANCHRVRTRRQFEAGEWSGGRPRFSDSLEDAKEAASSLSA